ncbi:hypothetical protein HCBG_05922 [Histoplasma capsulatum G186AR]|uniref:Secreted protein n=2 Tax=Ajellomyces capsulatus TaxID=5037 RepID=C0NRZ2_AJECG|nr:uncharacterized protein HCBG_05922 [Histoplasma capsulatum G186AR]EEH05658.1 hypothetical protein HCBG_05922 [Histoplasma capsulatum G186AR]KAG5300188.1 conidiation-specific protein 13, 2nd best hit [Histoplasma capsulatum]QSS67181.1 conidiation-specific protein 13, 2nd best hit [Histoplasma capsulatum G186AR]
MVITALCQLTLLGLASAQVVKRPLLNSVDELLPKIDAVLPAAQKYSLTKWTTAEVDQTVSLNQFWKDTLEDKDSEFYCKDDLTVYNVTFIDCPEPWLVGHCAKAETTKEATFDLLGRLPSSARGVISDLLLTVMRPGFSMRAAIDHSVIFASRPAPYDEFKMMVTALRIGSPGIPEDKFAEAVAADSCVADQPAADKIEKDGNYGSALEAGLTVVAYLKLVKSPPLDASCMQKQLDFLKPYLDARWDAPGQCPNKVPPNIVKYKPVAFPDGLQVLDVDPVPAPRATVVQWDKSDGYPELCWNLSQYPKMGGPDPWCKAENLNIYNVTYSDCPDQDPWALCHCSDAQISADSMVVKFGRLTPGLRSHVRHLLVINYDGIGASDSAPDYQFIASAGDAPDSSLMTAATTMLADGFYNTDPWINAISRDTCWPTMPYNVQFPWYEILSATGAIYLYDSSGKSMLERGYDVSCMSNGMRALGAYHGSDFKQGGKCFKRKPNDPIVHPDTNNLLPSGPNAVSEEIVKKLFRPSPVWKEIRKNN